MGTQAIFGRSAGIGEYERCAVRFDFAAFQPATETREARVLFRGASFVNSDADVDSCSTDIPVGAERTLVLTVLH